MRSRHRKISRVTFGICLVLGLTRPILAPAAETADDPRGPIKALTTTLLATMKEAKSLGFEGRRDKLAPALRETFDFSFMARLAVGSHWSKLSAAQQERFTHLFGDMSIATFAARFDGYAGQTFEVGDPRDGPRDTRLVPTKLIHPESSKEPVTISYLMRETDAGWQAVDVYLKGTYSEIATKRSEYSSIIKRKGFDALVARIQDKIAELSDGDSRGGAADGS